MRDNHLTYHYPRIDLFQNHHYLAPPKSRLLHANPPYRLIIPNNRKLRTHTEAALQFLVDKYPSLVAHLAKASGTKESRHAHFLADEEVLEQQTIADAISDSAAVVRGGRQNQIAEMKGKDYGLASPYSEFTVAVCRVQATA